jgi:DNA helicase-2/ATP-dependent DNA helicase PcrA
VLTSAGWSERPPAARGATRERWEAMNALVGLADDLARLGTDDQPATVATLVAELEERATAQHAPTVEGVTLASLHAAKGLEWDAVFLAGTSEGLMPISLAETDDAIAEERRLLYVGVTRARVHLEVSFARSRNPGGRASRKRTRFLDGLWPDEPRGRATTAARRQRGQARMQLTGEADVELFDALREWRLSVARETDKPAYTILGDATLAEIAEVRPTSIAGLARINGIGPAKIDRYGSTILALVAAAGTP